MSETKRTAILLPFGLPSLAGNFFDRSDLENIFPEFKQRVEDGHVLVEFGRPEELKSQEAVRRFHQTDLTKVCAKIVDTEITESGITATFEPFGPHADDLVQLLNPDTGILPMFSMRSIVQQRNMKAVPQRILGFNVTSALYDYDSTGPMSYGVHSANGLAPGLYARSEAENVGQKDTATVDGPKD